jgi:hypothetical protein
MKSENSPVSGESPLRKKKKREDEISENGLLCRFSPPPQAEADPCQLPPFNRARSSIRKAVRSDSELFKIIGSLTGAVEVAGNKITLT